MTAPVNTSAPATALAGAESPRTLGVILLGRLALNLQMRFVYPFLPAISRGLGVPLETASLLLTARFLVSALSPLYGMLADRVGRRTMMLAGLTALVVGAILAGLAPTFGVALAAFALLGFSKASYDPAMQAYLADAVPYERRGRVLSLVELSWSLSWFIGVPAAGFMIAAAGWRAPFWPIAGLGLIGLIATWRLCPDCGHPAPGEPAAPGSRRTWPTWAAPSTLLALTVAMLLVFANENLFVVYGAWLEDKFGLAITAVGLASLEISVAELLGEGAAVGLVDRIGKHRAVLGGLLLNVAAYLLLPRLAGGLAGALIGVAVMFLAFEFSIVALIPLLTELAPAARGTVMALSVAIMALGRLVGSLSGPRLWGVGGLALNAAVSAGAATLAALILWLWVREKPPAQPG